MESSGDIMMQEGKVRVTVPSYEYLDLQMTAVTKGLIKEKSNVQLQSVEIFSSIVHSSPKFLSLRAAMYESEGVCLY